MLHHAKRILLPVHPGPAHRGKHPKGLCFFDVPRVVRHGIDTNLFQDDHRPSVLYNAKENIVFTEPTEGNVEPELIVIEVQSVWNILYDEERGDGADLWFGHERCLFLISMSC
jgi:hypothetical protein